jgi:hypothetical protein
MKEFDQFNRRDFLTVLTAILGSGVLSTIITQLFTMDKTRSETEKNRAEAGKLSSDTEPTEPPPNSEPRNGWFLAGSNPEDYEVGIDQNQRFHGKRTRYIKSRKSSRGFGTVMQMFNANLYSGKRLMLAGNAQSAGVAQWAGFWMRVDGPNNKVLTFDNMADRPIGGTRGWTEYQVVLDVPDDSANIAFGLLLSGAGQVWMADIRLEIVSLNVPTTNIERVTVYPDKPVNLNVDE